MQKRLFVGLFAAAFMLAGTPASAITDSTASPTSAVGDIQAQLQLLMKQVEALRQQLAALQASLGTPVKQQAQTTPGATPAKKRVCAYMLRNLEAGAEGEDVRALQEFLHENGLLGVKPTGYFGDLTSDAVKKWQEKEGIEKAGNFGPLSRERLLAWCGTEGGKMMSEEKKEAMKWDEMKKEEKKKEEEKYKTENKAPSISSVAGPSSLKAGETGTWTVSAADPENDTLRYRIVWNDPSYNQQTVKGGDDGFVSGTTFTHAYPEKGAYTIYVYVQDSKGNQAKFIGSVSVTE